MRKRSTHHPLKERIPKAGRYLKEGLGKVALEPEG